ncbi:hypothetical protein DL764_002300 [Monosporascus ibericus]|uniref:Uncharacterized protein n=1 Tax=Monosporascus ibericus TaxID=155417 RepID=A0A4Q4TL26_9PEZI|nr:hypothetical protein DL764_002300 [Monosporascus ibericus]
MPFDFKAYDAKCNGLTPEELQREWEHYTRLISGASTSTAVSGLAVPFTMGVSTIGVAMAAPAIHNARKKRDIIEKHLQKHGTTHVTRKRDVVGSMAVSGTIGIVTLGVGTAGADAVATAGAEHGISAVVENETAIKIVTHAALDGVGMGIEHAHTSHLKKKDAVNAFQAAGVFQAVDDAKAAEAGYSIQPYNPQNFAVGSSTTQISPPPPPPPYTPGAQRPPSYCATPSHVYASDLKTFRQTWPTGGTTTSETTSMRGVLEPNFPTQTNPQGPKAYYSIPYAPSGPLTPVQQPSQVQNDQPRQQFQQYTTIDCQIPRELPSGHNPSSVVETYDMKSMVESLPPPGIDSTSLCEKQRRDSIVRRPVAEQQPQESQIHSPLYSSQPAQHDDGSQSQSVSHDIGVPPPPITRAGTQSQANPQRELQPSLNPQADSAALSSSPQHSQASGLSQHIPQSPPQQSSSPPTTAPNYGEHTTAPSFIAQERPCLEVPGPTGHDNPKRTHDNYPKPVHQQYNDYIQEQQTGMSEDGNGNHWQPDPQQYLSHVKQQHMGMSPDRQHIYPQTSHQQHLSHIQQPETGGIQGPYRNYAQPHRQQHPGYIQQQQTGMSQGTTGQQPQQPASLTQRYSLQSGLSPSPLPPSSQFTPTGSQGIPYFPPPPGQPQAAHSPAPFTLPPPPAPRNSVQRKPVQPSTAAQVQYPPVSIPESYPPVEIPASYHQAPPSAQQQYQLGNLSHSNPQQPASQMHSQMSSFPQGPLTTPNSPPQIIQYAGSSYFQVVANHEYQNMYPTYQR